jgi:hypothetical protein
MIGFEIGYNHNFPGDHVKHMNNWCFVITAEKNTFSVAVSKTLAYNLVVQFGKFSDGAATKRMGDSRHVVSKMWLQASLWSRQVSISVR